MRLRFLVAFLRNSVLGLAATRRQKMVGGGTVGSWDTRFHTRICQAFYNEWYNRCVDWVGIPPTDQCISGTACPTFSLKEIDMSIATQWKAVGASQDAIATQVRKLYRTSDKAKVALMPEFARAYGEELSFKLDGSIKGWAKDGAAKKSLNRLLLLAFKGKKAAGGKSTDPVELLVAYVAKRHEEDGMTKAQCLRAVEAAFRK